MKNKMATISPAFAGLIGIILNLLISYYGTKMWAADKHFYDMSGIALIFVFLFIFILATPITVICTQILFDLKAK